MTTIAPGAPPPYAPPATSVPVAPPSPATEARTAPWSLALRVGFRFAAAWLVLVNGILGAFAELPGVDWLAGKYEAAKAPLLEWVGAHVVHTAAPAVQHPNGAGDKTVFWVEQLVVLVLAVVIAAVWSALDRRRTEYRRAHAWLRAFVRFTLGATMLGYGAFKVIQLQFPPPMLMQLIQPYGQSSPMGILWKLMGHSYGYNLFTGLAEAVPATLLFWRRTTTLGALLLVAALANVFAMNMAFDVTVKGYSLQLLLMAGFLLLPDARRLWDAVVMQRAVPARPLDVLFDRAAPRRTAQVVGTLLGLWFVGSTFWDAWQASRQDALASRPPLYGIYEVESFAANGAERPPLATDATRWRRFVVDRRGLVVAQAMNDSLVRFRGSVDTAKRWITLKPAADSTHPVALSYVPVGADRLRVSGVLGADTISALLRRIDHTRFTLLARERQFHWVQDNNFNR